MQDRTNTGSPVTGTMDSAKSGQLAHMSEMDDYEVVDGEPDIRGWDVRTVAGEKVGTVEDLLVDTSLLKVRYIDLKLSEQPATEGDDRHVLLPIGSARLDEDVDDVLISLRVEHLLALPMYVRGELTREYERSLLTGFAQPDQDPPLFEDTGAFYDGEYFDERRTFEGRRATEHRDDAHLRRRGAQS